MITDVAPALASSRAIRVGTSYFAAQDAVTIIGNIIKGSGAGKGFANGIKIGVTGQTLTNITVTGNTVQPNAIGISIVSSAAGVTINNNNINGNTTYGVFNADTGTLNAENNWWGSASGPYNATTNPSGTGNAVSAHVDYTPLLILPISSDATLSGFTISSGTLTPAFASGTIGYTDVVNNSMSSVIVTPTVNQSHATIRVNGTTVTSGSASGVSA